MRLSNYEKQESYIYRNGILPNLNKMGCYVERIENSIGQGMPDIFILRKGDCVFAELKADDRKHLFVRPWQFNKLNKYELFGARAIIIRAHFEKVKGNFGDKICRVHSYSFYKAPLEANLKIAGADLTEGQKAANPDADDFFKFKSVVKIKSEPYAHLKLGEFDAQDFINVVFGYNEYEEK